jgi:hypothetical protein
MLKKVGIEVSGSGGEIKEDYVVTEETTAQELLTRANLTEYQLCPTSNQLPFNGNEKVYEKVGDGSVLFAYRKATAGALAPALSFQGLYLRRDWTKRDKWCYGYYRTKFGSFEGKIRTRLILSAEYYLRYPPEEMKKHRHWGCFQKRDKGWYSVHFTSPPKSIEDGIKTMEEILVESFMKAQNIGGE